MTKREFLNLMEATYRDLHKLCNTKGEEYTRGNDDQLKNFKVAAMALDLPPLTIWSVYFNKHIDAIMNYVKTGETKSTESIDSRFHDAILYLFLGLALIKDASK